MANNRSRQRLRVPLASSAVSANTIVLMHMDGANGGTSFAEAGGKTVTRYGTPTTSTAQSKFGGASGIFAEATPDYLTVANAGVGTGDLTVEGQIYLPALTGLHGAFHLYTGVPDATDAGLYVHFDCTGATKYLSLHRGGGNDSFLNITSAITAATWFHFAVARSGSTMTAYIDGTSVGSVTNSTDYSSYNVTTIGTAYFNNTSNALDGYIDEFRVSDIARYTANFTPPAAAFS